MRFYDRFEVGDGFDGTQGEHTPAWDALLATKVVIYQGKLGGEGRHGKVAEAEKVLRETSGEPLITSRFELFTTESFLWLVAPSETEAEPVVRALRSASLLPTPPPPLPRCAKCGKAAPAVGALCADCLKKPAWLGVGIAALLLVIAVVAVVVWSNQPKPAPKVQQARAPEVSFEIRPVRKGEHAHPFDLLGASSSTRANQGSFVVLSWRITDAQSVSIDHQIGMVPLSGERTLRVSGNITYTLTAHGVGGDTIRRVAVNVPNATDASGPEITPPAPRPEITPSPAPPPPAAPTINFFLAEPQTIREHESVNLRWSIGNATSVTISPGIGSVAASGTTSVTLDSATTFTLTATGPGGTRTSVRSIAVQPGLPTAQLTANGVRSETTIQEGQLLRLCWKTTFANSISLNGFSRAAVDCIDIHPTISSKYTLVAAGPGGRDSDELIVTVTPKPAPPPPTVPKVVSGELTCRGVADKNNGNQINIWLRWNPNAEGGQWSASSSNCQAIYGQQIPYSMFWVYWSSDEGTRSRPQLVTSTQGTQVIFQIKLRQKGMHTVHILWEKIPDYQRPR